jgi:hypothetical protein
MDERHRLLRAELSTQLIDLRMTPHVLVDDRVTGAGLLDALESLPPHPANYSHRSRRGVVDASTAVPQGTRSPVCALHRTRYRRRWPLTVLIRR